MAPKFPQGKARNWDRREMAPIRAIQQMPAPQNDEISRKAAIRSSSPRETIFKRARRVDEAPGGGRLGDGGWLTIAETPTYTDRMEQEEKIPLVDR